MKICQSCGLPMHLCPQNGGTNLDGSKNDDYCFYCYQRGSFTDGLSDVKEYKDYLYKMYRSKMKFPAWKAWFFTLGIPHLNRWK